ncbi:MAG: hypothetical protein NTV87_08885 [Ignavibacteriae bacterium]|nr:hypothetical protein [Ignavibacteriota bacterium]
MVSKNFNAHTVHVPVMGIGFTVDTPVRVAHLGISSVMSIGHDILIEKMRKHYCNLHNFPYEAITPDIHDYRAKRITAYLNLINKIVKDNFTKLIASGYHPGSGVEKYFALLPEYSVLKKNFGILLKRNPDADELQDWLRNNLIIGNIDVNIMTKVDKENFRDGELLPPEFNDAHAALRGFANSELESSVVLSAGINPRLYGYIENFSDFYPDGTGKLKKKIALKISDYRSAVIQGKFLAKKGLWVSEYRVESGLNCGGHAFATDGYLMGPILEEIKTKKESLIKMSYDLFARALKDKALYCPETPPAMRISAQGGVGTAEEHQFLLDRFDIDSVGWATPFLLVPEVTNVDDHTRELLRAAGEKDLYLSDVSPLGVPFNSLRGNTKDAEKQSFIDKGRPGSSCPDKYLSTNTEFTKGVICTASREYQNLKIQELTALGENNPVHDKHHDKIIEKSCLCVGLSASAMLVNHINMNGTGPAVAVCPGPNLAYFSEIVSLKKMVDHIYGRINIMKRKDRPHFFIKELGLYMDYFRNLTDSFSINPTDAQQKQLTNFRNNLADGIAYYKELFSELKTSFADMKENILYELEMFEQMAEELYAGC